MIRVRTSPQNELARLEEDLAVLLSALNWADRLKAELRLATTILTTLGELAPRMTPNIPIAAAKEIDRIAVAFARFVHGAGTPTRHKVETRFAKSTLAAIRRINTGAIEELRRRQNLARQSSRHEGE